MVVRQDQRRGIMAEGRFDDLSGVDAGAVHRPPEQLLVVKDAMPVIQVNGGEHLVLQQRHSCPEKLFGDLGAGNVVRASEPVEQPIPSEGDDFLQRGRPGELVGSRRFSGFEKSVLYG